MSNAPRELLAGAMLSMLAALALVVAGCSVDEAAGRADGSADGGIAAGDGAGGGPGTTRWPDPPLAAPARPSACASSALDTPTTLAPCAYGSGVFGYWHLDEVGLPAYEYTLDQRSDPRALYAHSRGPDARTHFHQLGNDRVNAIAYNEGYVELVGQERGVTFYNRHEPRDGNHAGGFSLIAEGDVVFNTAHRHMPAGARARRRFGMGYFETVTQHRGLRVTRRVVAPPGDDPLLVDEVTIENLSDRRRMLRHYEYWDVNRHQASFQPARTGPLAAAGDRARRAHNARFDQVLRRDRGQKLLRADFVLASGQARPPRDAVAAVDAHPSSVFLASLSEPADGVYTDQKAFLGAGGIAAPDAARSGRAGELLARHGAAGQRVALILRHDVELAPGAKRTLRFAYGYLPRGKDDPAKLLARYRAERDTLARTRAHWRGAAAYLAVDDPGAGARALSRELPWHAYYLLSATATLDYFETRVTPQGSAYLYLHGFDGAPRDQALYAMPLSYLAPAMARANLELIMRLTRQDSGQISYSYHGHGVLEGAIIHLEPSDLDIFFLLALTEYLAATGDRAYLDKRVPFYPRSSTPATVLEHARVAFRHLARVVGRGEHGLVRLSDGDWSDGIVWQEPKKYDASSTVEHGESVPNTQMAAYALPRLAALLRPRDRALASAMRRYAGELADAARRTLRGSWFLRAWMRDLARQPVAVGAGSLDLQSQPWGVLADGLITPAQQLAVTEATYNKTDAGSRIGAMLGREGSYVWPAVSQLQTWAYMRRRPDLAWRSVLRHALANQAAAFPEQWYGIWSGPDGRSGKSGRVWSSVATPMTDWPVMNQNTHAMALLGVIRALGVEPEGLGLRVQPNAAAPDTTVDLPLLRLSKRGDRASGEYRAVDRAARLTLTLRAPLGRKLVSASGPDNKPLSIDADGAARLRLDLVKGQRASFAFGWK